MPLVRRLDRYVVAEVSGPLALGFLVYTFILLLQLLFKLAELIIRRGLDAEVVGRLVWLSLPNILVLTIPMSLLFGILIAVGRLAADSELIAMRSSGVSLYQLYRPILLLSLALAGVNTFIAVRVLPEGNRQYSQLLLEIGARDISSLVEPRVFNENWPGKVLYVFDVPERSQRWQGVFFSEALPTGQTSEVTVAEWGEIQLDEAGERVVLHLENATTHRVDLSKPGEYQTTRHRSLDRVLEEAFTSTQKARVASRAPNRRELTIPQLAARADDPAVGAEDRNLYTVEIHKKLAIPMACVVFGLIALPLGFNNRRGGKSSGFAISIALILFYWILLNHGEDSARLGRMPPWLAMWLPNLLLLGAGVFLLIRRNRDRSSWLFEAIGSGFAVLAGSVARLVIERQERRQEARRHAAEARLAAAAAATSPPGAADEPHPASPQRLLLRLERPRLRFPKLLDRYVLRLFGGVFVLVGFSLIAIFVIADLSENTADILRHNVPRSVVLAYYQLLTIPVIYEFAPIMVLVTTLVTFSIMARRNEITACRALGVSLYRLSLPGLIAALLVTMGSFVIQERMLPAASERIAQLKDVIRGRDDTAKTYRRADRQWLFGQGRFMYNYLRYDPKTQSLHRLSVFEFDKEHRLVARLLTEQATYRDGEWVFAAGWARTFAEGGKPSLTQFSEPRVVDLPETPAFFETEIQRPDQMSYAQLRSYVQDLRDTGQPSPELEVALENKIAFPVIALVMALVGMPFAFRLGRRGALYGLGISLMLGMIFLAIFAFFKTLGQAGALPPIIAVWSPNAIFGLLAAYLFLDLKS